MNWFKNLNATPRLMSSFGVLLVLTMGISVLAISSLGKANDRMEGLYQEQLKSSISLDNIAIDKLDIARAARDGILNGHDSGRRMCCPDCRCGWHCHHEFVLASSFSQGFPAGCASGPVCTGSFIQGKKNRRNGK